MCVGGKEGAAGEEGGGGGRAGGGGGGGAAVRAPASHTAGGSRPQAPFSNGVWGCSPNGPRLSAAKPRTAAHRAKLDSDKFGEETARPNLWLD